MSIKTMIQDGEGTNLTAGVTADKALKVTNIPLSVKEALETNSEVLIREKVYNAYFLDSSESAAANVDASSEHLDYSIGSEESKMKSIYYVKFIIEDQMMSFGASEGKRFASAAGSEGLTNGIRMFTKQQGLLTDIFAEPIKHISDFMKYSDDIINEPDAIGSGVDLLVAKLSFVRPINIMPGEIDSVTVRVNDDLSSVNYFKVIAGGIQEIVE